MMNEELIISHAKKLRFLRKRSDKTQHEVATHLGLSQQAYSKLENAETSFSDETIEKLSNFFEITPAEFESVADSVYIGNNNSNTGSNIHVVDLRLIETVQKMNEQNTKLFEQLIQEKDARIKLLEELLKK